MRGEGWGEFNSHGVVLRDVTLRSRRYGRTQAYRGPQSEGETTRTIDLVYSRRRSATRVSRQEINWRIDRKARQNKRTKTNKCCNCNPSHAFSKHGKSLDASSTAQPALAPPVPLKAYQRLAFDIQRGKADQISSFSAAYSLLVAWRCIQQHLSKMAHNSTSTCRRGRAPMRCAECSLASSLYMSPRQCLCLLPLAEVELCFTFLPMAETWRGRAKGMSRSCPNAVQ